MGNAGFLPYLTLSAQLNRRPLGSGFGGAGPLEDGALDVAVTLRQTLFDGFRRATIYRRLRVLENQAEIGAHQVTEQTLRDIAILYYDLYYDLARQQQQLQALREAIQISEDRLEIAEFRLEVGSASELEVHRAQVDRNADRAALLRQELALKTGKAALNELLARSVATDYPSHGPHSSGAGPGSRSVGGDSASGEPGSSGDGIRRHRF